MPGQPKIQPLNQSAEMGHPQWQWSAVIEDLPVGLIIIDHGGLVQAINKRALEIFDLNRNEVVQPGGAIKPTAFVNLLPGGEQAHWQTLIVMVQVTGTEYVSHRHYHHARYAEKILSFKISAIPDLTEAGHGAAIAVWDITDQVMKEKYVILSEKLVARGEMAAFIAAELDGYLNSIVEKSRLIQSNLEQEKLEAVRFNAAGVEDGITRIKHYLRESLEYSEPQTAFILYDIRRVIEDLLLTLRIKPRFRDIFFTVDLAADIPEIEMDVGQIQYVIKNLLNNAADTLAEKAEKLAGEDESFDKEIAVEATWNSQNDELKIVATDNGGGILPEVQAKMFNLHFSTKKNSRGLGLHRCLQVVKQHSGRLELVTTPGEGSSFSLVLPRFMKS